MGPYTAQWLTAQAEELVRYMEAEHLVTRPHPADPRIFERHPRDDRLACGCASLRLLGDWFGRYLRPLWEQGAHVCAYDVPADAIVDHSPDQMLFTLRRASAVRRLGCRPPAPLIRSSAGARAEIIAASNGRYDNNLVSP